MAYYNAGEFEMAIQAYQEVLDNYPRSPLIIEAVNGINSLPLLSAGQEDTSSELLEAFIPPEPPRQPPPTRLRFRQAEFLLRTADYEGAVEAFRDYIRVTNATRLVPEAYFNLGRSIPSAQPGRAGDSGLRRQFYAIIPEGWVGRAESALLNLGMIQFSNTNYELALDYFTRLQERTQRLRNEAGVGRGKRIAGVGRLNEGRTGLSGPLFQRGAGNLEPARLGLAKVLLRLNQNEEAEPILQEIANNNSLETGAEAMYWLGYIHQQRGQTAEALETYSRSACAFRSL